MDVFPQSTGLPSGIPLLQLNMVTQALSEFYKLIFIIGILTAAIPSYLSVLDSPGVDILDDMAQFFGRILGIAIIPIVVALAVKWTSDKRPSRASDKAFIVCFFFVAIFMMLAGIFVHKPM